MKTTTHKNKDGLDVITVDPGDEVYCDICNKNYTNLPDKGGIQFESKAVCPECTPRIEQNAKRYREERFIKATCPEGKSFANWVREDLR